MFDDFYNISQGFSRNFAQDSNLHEFIRFMLERFFYEEFEQKCGAVDGLGSQEAIGDIKPFWMNLVLMVYHIDHLSFQRWVEDNSQLKGDIDDMINAYMYEFLNDKWQELLQELTNDIFPILFANRGFLLEFNRRVART
ncbi:hypothetical protein [Paenibacillus agricola]|uniref:hypothetical protein n=1 Tax=Paenibacillus agricola TaxID=2716264 RepID=UPI001A9D9107|nr:hypothetical protein [Paenibacillus agricola]